VSVLISKAVLVAASKVMRTVLTETDTCPHADVHVSLAGVDGVTLIKFAEILNRTQEKTTALYAPESVESLRDLFKGLDCDIVFQLSSSSSQPSHPGTNLVADPKSSECVGEEGETFHKSDDVEMNEITVSTSEELKEVIDEGELKESKIKLKNIDEIDKMIIKDGKVYKCGICERPSRDRSNLRRHVETHVEGLSYQCTLCFKSLKTKTALYMHSRTHTSKSSSNKENGLKRNLGGKNHKPVVQGEQAPDGKTSDHVTEDFECNICKKTFKYIKSLKHHTKVFHKVEDEASRDSTHEVDFPSGLHYCCSSCQEIFDEDELEAHKKETGHEEATKFRYPANFPGWK